jgi:hypothetical protein
MGKKKSNSNGQEVQTQSLTRDDIRNFLLAYSGTIALDQVRVDALPPGSFHREYDRGLWQRYRQGHLDFINRLLATIGEIPSSLLQKLTCVAAVRKTAVVQKAIIDLLSQASTHSLAPDQIDSSPLFFRSLVEDVGTGSIGGVARGNSRVRMMRWLIPIDPLRIADDPECGYLADLQREDQTEEMS